MAKVGILTGSRHLRKSLSNNKLTPELAEQRLQWPHTTKNVDFIV